MKLSSKDKSLLLLIAATLIVIWSVFSFFSSLVTSATFGISDASKIIVKKNDQWFNVSRPLEVSDLKGRLILLDFWTYDCVSCIQAIAEIKKLEKQFGSKLTVIGVHSGKFSNQKDASAIRKAILKYDIDHPVVNDSELKIWNNFKVKSWPTFILLNPRGNIFKTYVGENELPKVKSDVKKLVSRYKFRITHNPLPAVFEKYNVIANVLDFPTKLEYGADFSYKSHQSPALFISNSGQNNIIISSLSGDIITKIGSGKEGLQDGSFDMASFNMPQGLLYTSGKLYVADTANNALREIDFKKGVVKTLIGSGQNGDIIESSGEALETKNLDLSAPTDIEFFPDKNNIAIANSGTNQILSYNIKNGTITVLAGNGEQGITDGKYPENSLAQTSDMSAFGRKLYFVDSRTSALRVLEENGVIKTLIGKSLTKFGHSNGDKNSALMQYPLGLSVDDTGAYISDSFNHVIRKYDFASNQIRDIAGSLKKGDSIGTAVATQFDEPVGIISILDRFYVADSNNNRIVILSRGSFNSELFEVMPPLKLPKEGFLEYLPNLQKSPDLDLKAESEIVLKINLKKGWKINEAGPSFINLLDLVKDDQANLVASFDWHDVKNSEFKLPKLKAGNNYVLQGAIYYCQDKKNALCYVKSYEQKIITDNGAQSSTIEIELGN